LIGQQIIAVNITREMLYNLGIIKICANNHDINQ
jgi:hypothetical protein